MANAVLTQAAVAGVSTAISDRARPAAASRRHTVHASSLALVEDFAASPDQTAPSGHSPQYQIVLPYFGAFLWKVGSRSALLDSNRILFVGAGEDFSETHDGALEGLASSILTPGIGVLEELCGSRGPAQHEGFLSISMPMTARAQLLNHRLLRCRPSVTDPLVADELTAALLTEALKAGRHVMKKTPLAVVDRAKQVLHACHSQRMTLGAVAQEVGVSGAYLTQAFTRCEGVPLYCYQTRLRLGRALVELPHCEDIAALALELGFSSHSHFTNAFSAAFGIAPSQFRSSDRRTRPCPTARP